MLMHAYKLMLCIVFMEVSGGQLTKYISGEKNKKKNKNKTKTKTKKKEEKKTLFNRLSDGQPHLFS